MNAAGSNFEELEVVPGFTHEQLQGWVPELASETEIREALEKAFDYRGDVTITRKDGRKVEGYVFDRKQGASLEASLVRILPADGSPRQSIPFSEIAGLVFSGRDTAAGKSWEAWVRKYWQKKQSGQAARIEPEALD
ncbi:MAG TPA: hypothetical protein VKX25_07905 [Bryobacteraceae bacterium]|jgi:hypothetical protein|nr:hypothetical protein [Bryobacteraceae bacterium]